MEFEKLQDIVADVLNVQKEDIRPETTFVDDLGADSLDIFQIIMGIEEEFDIEIDNDEAEKIVTVQDAVDQEGCRIISRQRKSPQGLFPFHDKNRRKQEQLWNTD